MRRRILTVIARHHPIRLFCLLGAVAAAGLVGPAACTAQEVQPAAAAIGTARGSFTRADFDAHIQTLRKKLPSKDFSIVVAAPFVVIGDEPRDVVAQRAERTVKWAVEKLKKAYFTEDPRLILDIWLFKDNESYMKNCKRLFGKTPDTPYGYYSHEDKALVMNIHTGGGTLVHEIVHPFVAANFPDCPAWFNEGLGSLYEESCEVGGEIRGLTNWRLPRLQETIRKGKLPSFDTLCHTSDTEFYEKDRGADYAQARYLCYYLQEKGLLQSFYRRFLAGREKDPSGYKTLQAVLGRNDMATFQKEWEAYVMKLRFGEGD